MSEKPAASNERQPRRETGHARLLIDWRFIEDLLQLPEGVTVAGIYEYPQIAGMMVHLTGDALPRVPRYQEPPYVTTAMHAVRTEDGKRVVYGIEVMLPEEEEVEEEDDHA